MTYNKIYADYIAGRITIAEFVKQYRAIFRVGEVKNGDTLSDQGVVSATVSVSAPSFLPYGGQPGASTFSWVVLPPSQPAPAPVITLPPFPVDPRVSVRDREWVKREDERVSHPYIYTKQQAAQMAQRIARDNHAAANSRLYVFPWAFPINVGNRVALGQPHEPLFKGKVYSVEYNATGAQCTKSVLVFPYDS